ncbi:MAG: MltA domain-containing protein [Desulfobacterales bacterium]|nr:MltA domain-containing protein [Desulfobacterales bacterium]MDP6683190.1 MltA domain-containing protein [Desulfobacterales bacterium]MDP6806389.1 MltA domain-containing protein [Desulfobacterales bacterium]
MNYEGLEHAIGQSIAYLNRISHRQTFSIGKEEVNAVQMIDSLEHFLRFIRTAPSKGELNHFIVSNYWVYKSVGAAHPEQVYFTGYYEPILEGSAEKNGDYKSPVHTRPGDLVTIDLSLFSTRFKGEKIIGRYMDRAVVPYWERKEIVDEGRLEGVVPPLAWVKDPVDIFFLQIQGSGKIYLDNNTAINVHYDTTNGRPYRSIGKLLIDQGKILRTEMSMQKIREYLKNHPKEIEPILNHNPSYVFFKLEKEGPIGFLDVKLTPGRSIALDRRIFPLSALAFIEAQQPFIDGGGRIRKWSPFGRFVLNQDTGGAIRGPGRADLFWGNGPYAEIAAGYMQHMGTLYFLLRKVDP